MMNINAEAYIAALTVLYYSQACIHDSQMSRTMNQALNFAVYDNPFIEEENPLQALTFMGNRESIRTHFFELFNNKPTFKIFEATIIKLKGEGDLKSYGNRERCNNLGL